RTLEPSETAEPEEVSVDLDDTLAVALAKRPGSKSSRSGVTGQQLNEKIAGTALLPVLNVVGSYGVNGLSGTNRTAVFGSTTTFSLTTITGANCRARAPTQGFLCNIPGLAPPSPFAGSASEAYDRMLTNDFSAYSF